jgi:hypothetical protein
VESDGSPRAADEQVRTGDRYQWTCVHDFAHSGEFEQVETDLHQTNCATEDPDRAWQHLNCRSCWIYFMTNLKSVLAGGPDIRDHEHPTWNDSVSIGFDPDAGPGQPRVPE